MSDATIFLIGLAVSAITFGGLVFTILETKRLGRESDERAALETRAAGPRGR